MRLTVLGWMLKFSAVCGIDASRLAILGLRGTSKNACALGHLLAVDNTSESLKCHVMHTVTNESLSDGVERLGPHGYRRAAAGARNSVSLPKQCLTAAQRVRFGSAD